MLLEKIPRAEKAIKCKYLGDFGGKVTRLVQRIEIEQYYLVVMPFKVDK